MGMPLASLLTREERVPTYRVLFTGRVEWLRTTEEVDQFRLQQQARLGRELVVGEEGQSTGDGDAFEVSEEPKAREVNRGLDELRKLGLSPTLLVPALRVAGREPPPRLLIENGEHRHHLEHLRELSGEVRRQGERGMNVTRFKGLGEMDPDELGKTTLDPDKRTLMQVKLDDALKADEMFRTLMGEKVEPRREFINKYALDVKEIDYHGA
jgi:DNA gyrase subunit B